jgi:hypothetical protein
MTNTPNIPNNSKNHDSRNIPNNRFIRNNPITSIIPNTPYNSKKGKEVEKP